MSDKREMETVFHMVMLTACSVLCALLVAIDLVSGWNRWAILPIVGINVVCWVLHLRDVFSPVVRLYIYVFSILGILGFYAAQPATITDIPILLCLLIILLSRQNDSRLVIITALSYIAYILENIFAIGYLNAGTEQIVISRIILGIFCLLTATVISTYFMGLQRRDDNEKELLREEVTTARKDTEHFLSNMSHELRTPINVVGGISEIMLKSNPAPEDEENLLAIFKAGQRMRRQVSDILTYSELQTGHFRLSETAYEPASLVQDVVSSVFSADPTDLDFVVDFAPDIPKTLYGDEKSLKKVLYCLLDNAVKFTTQGGGHFSVRVRRESYGVNFNVDVEDTGTGVRAEKNGQLFHGVYAGDTGSRRTRGGLGLGLTIALGLTEAMHGFLKVESGSGGTRMHVSIPQAVKDEKASVFLERPEDFRILFWLSPDHLEKPEVRRFYDGLMEHLQRELGLSVQVVASVEKVRALEGTFTHLLLTWREYALEKDYILGLSGKVPVCLWTQEKRDASFGEGVTILPWPVSTLSLVTALEQTREGVLKEGAGFGQTSSGQSAASVSAEASYGQGAASVSAEESYGQSAASGSAEAPSGQAAAAAAAAGEETEPLPRKVALVVDDEKMNLMVARGILKKCGVTAETAMSGPEAVEKCMEKKYDIIFMDYMMPDMNGTEAMQEIRTLQDGYYETCPIVILTANAVSGAKEQFLADGFDEFLSKPVNIKAMEKTLRRQLKGGAA